MKLHIAFHSTIMRSYLISLGALIYLTAHPFTSASQAPAFANIRGGAAPPHKVFIDGEVSLHDLQVMDVQPSPPPYP
jgi:hypothetical protein